MARLKSATFLGNPPSDVDVDSPTWRRVLERAQGDLALIYDKVTGLNGHAASGDVINHNGTRGQGARLGVPWINQAFAGRDDRAGQFGIDLAYTNALDNSAKGDGSFGNDTIIFGCPVFIPPGETDMSIVITGKGLDAWPWRMQLLLESSGAELFAGDLTFSQHPYGDFDQLTLSTNDNGTDGATTGKLCLLLIYADTTHRQAFSGTTADGQVKAYSLFAGPTRIRPGSSSPPSRMSTSPYMINTGGTTFTPFKFRDFDSTLLVNRLALHSYITGGISRNLNALIEYIRGWPVGNNAAYQLADSGTAEPLQSKFLAHTRSADAGITQLLLSQFGGSAILLQRCL